MLHELKTWPEMFHAVKSGKKRFELRRDDRGFQEGDRLRLMEWNPNARPCYTGHSLLVRVTFVLRDAEMFGLASGFCAMSIAPDCEDIT